MTACSCARLDLNALTRRASLLLRSSRMTLTSLSASHLAKSAPRCRVSREVPLVRLRYLVKG